MIITNVRLKVYGDIKSYLDDHIGFNDRILENFQSIFVAYFLLLALYLFCFIINARKLIFTRLRCSIFQLLPDFLNIRTILRKFKRNSNQTSLYR